MLTHPTIDQMHQLGLAGMARAFAELEANPQNSDLSHAEWLPLLLDREATERYERRLRARLRYVRLRHQASVEDVDYRAARGLGWQTYPNHRRKVQSGVKFIAIPLME